MGFWVDSVIAGAAIMSLAGTIMFSSPGRDPAGNRSRVTMGAGTVITALLLTVLVVRTGL